MYKSVDDIITEIGDHVCKSGDDFPDWYAGITKDLERRLFEDHKVLRGRVNLYIHYKAESACDARAVGNFLTKGDYIVE